MLPTCVYCCEEEAIAILDFGYGLCHIGAKCLKERTYEKKFIVLGESVYSDIENDLWIDDMTKSIIEARQIMKKEGWV